MLPHGWTLKNMMPHERSQTQKVPCCIIPFICNIQNGQGHRDRKYMGVCQGLGGEMESKCLMGLGFHFGGDEKVLELDRGSGCTTL